MPGRKSPYGIQIDSPDQRQWMSLRLDRQHPPDGLDRLRRGRLPASAKVQVTDLDPQRSHARRIVLWPAPPTTPRPTISTHVLDTERGVPAVGRPRDAVPARVADGKPIRMTQALTDADGRVRDLLERPLVAGEYRLEFDVGPRGRLVLHQGRRRPAHHRRRALVPRPAAARAVLDDDVPRVVTRAVTP